jgi:thiamine pyrophosphokinase
LLIAADGGYDFLKKSSLEADILIGDFDSIKVLPNHHKIIKHPVEKDDTDTFLAYKTAYDIGYRNFIIYGGIGGRLDHTMANLQLLANIAQSGGRGFLLGDNCVVTAIKDCEISFSEKMKGTISVFCFEKAYGVKLEDNTALLEGVVSRKKQVVPIMTENA